MLNPDLLQAQCDEGQCDKQVQGMVADFGAAASWSDHTHPAARAESTMGVSADAKREVHGRGDGEVHINSNAVLINNGAVISGASLGTGSAGNVAVQDGLMISGALLSVTM